MAGKGTLSFNLTGAGVTELRRMMVHLRDPTLKLRQSGMSDQTLVVDEGRYYVSTRTPDGDEQVLAGPIEVSADASLSLDLSVEAAPNLTPPRPAISMDDGQGGQLPLPTIVPAPMVDAALWQGSWLSWWKQAGQEQVQVPIPGTTRYTLDRAYPLGAPPIRDDLLLAVDEGRSREMTFFAVPFDGPVYEPQRRPTRVTITRGASLSASRQSERPELAFAFDDPEVTELLEFVRKGLVRESQAYSEAAVEAARSELLYKRESPLGAVIGIYVLLRANAIDGLDIATMNLMNIAPGMPDSLPLRVEYLARTARHNEAVAVLQQAQACPWFRSGVTYLLSRARSYLGASSTTASSSTTTISLTSRARAEITLVASGLELLSAYLDPNRTVATYRHVPVAG